MSNFLAIATVTATLRDLLEIAAKEGVTAATATHVSPGNSNIGLPDPGVNIYLYEVTPNAALGNSDLPTRARDGSITQRPRVALDLHYLLSFYGDEPSLEPQRVLGSVAHTLHAQPLLTRKNIQDAVASLPDLSKSDLADELELVKFTPMSLSLEELSRLWSVFLQTSYRLSMVYTASVVLIEKEETPRTVLPVQERNIFVMPSLEGATQPPISPDELLDLQLWLKSDTGVTYDSNGVSLWADQSGNDNNAVQNVDSVKPAFVAHGLGSKPVLRFDGVDDYLAIEKLTYSAPINGITVCALVRSDFDDPPELQIIVSFDREEHWRLALNDDLSLILNIGWDTSDSGGGVPHDLRSTASYTDGNWHLVCGWFSAGSDPDKQIFVDGEQVASTNAYNGILLGTVTPRFGFIGVGSKAPGFDGPKSPSNFLRGDVAEILIYNRALTDDERRQLERYFVDRYRS